MVVVAAMMLVRRDTLAARSIESHEARTTSRALHSSSNAANPSDGMWSSKANTREHPARGNLRVGWAPAAERGACEAFIAPVSPPGPLGYQFHRDHRGSGTHLHRLPTWTVGEVKGRRRRRAQRACPRQRRVPCDLDPRGWVPRGRRSSGPSAGGPGGFGTLGPRGDSEPRTRQARSGVTSQVLSCPAIGRNSDMSGRNPDARRVSRKNRSL